MMGFAKAVYARVCRAFKAATQQAAQHELILYLRVDAIETEQGPVLIECEGVEPELFFRAKPESVKHFCQVVTNLM